MTYYLTIIDHNTKVLNLECESLKDANHELGNFCRKALIGLEEDKDLKSLVSKRFDYLSYFLRDLEELDISDLKDRDFINEYFGEYGYLYFIGTDKEYNARLGEILVDGKTGDELHNRLSALLVIRGHLFSPLSTRAC